jgi:hypothetical protein
MEHVAIGSRCCHWTAFVLVVRVIDDFAVEKIRQIEAKYPVLTTSTENVLNTFNEKTEPVRQVMNSVKDTTTSTIQHGRNTVMTIDRFCL